MSGNRYTEEFKIEAVKQVTERGHAVAEVEAGLGVSVHSMYQWVKRYSVAADERQAILATMDVMAAHCDSYSLLTSWTMRTARAIISGK